MPYLAEKLTALEVEKITKPGWYHDGAGLYLQVNGDGKTRIAKSWVYCYMLRGRTRSMGLGSYKIFSLAEARTKALECRRMCYEGIDPIDARKARKAQAALEAVKGVTFKHCAEKYVAAHKAAWRNPKHAAQWDATLNAYAYPVIGDLSAQSIDTGLILKILEPIWSTKAETASRIRGRIEMILDWARVRGFRTGENPARWRGHLDKLLPARSKVRRIKHHPALPYEELPAFMAKLREEEGVAARALEFLIFTAARTGEVIGAVPAEVSNKVWTIPAERMKAGKEHRVPLPASAATIAEKMMNDFGETYVFPGGKAGKPLSNMAMLKVLARMNRSDLTTHGFRSTFRDWASECTDHAPEVVEMALAHTIDNKVEAAYRRGDLFNKRIVLMNDWARFCTSANERKIVPIEKCG